MTLNRIECHFRPLREFVLNASDYVSHSEVAVAFRPFATPILPMSARGFRYERLRRPGPSSKKRD